MPTDPKPVKEIFLEAAELPDESARAAYLDRACGGDNGLRSRVEALLRSHDPDGSFLGTPAAVVPDPEQAATRAFSPNAEHADTQTGDGIARHDDEVPLAFLSPATRDDSLGRIGHYEVLEVLGQGGFGIVFRAFDDVLQRVVAVKVMAPQLAATSPARKRFLREARSSAQVRHENVVHVYEVVEHPLPYLAMEFIPGETLQQRLDRVGPLEVMEVVRIGRQIAEGLTAAHATDLIHRDIKPSNILIEGGQEKVKLTDFGLARAADDASISQSGIIAGTPMFMAPEQAQGAKLDQRADLFSFGSVLFQMTSGRPPFRANGTVAVLKRVAEDKPRGIREIIPETPQWLCNIIAKLHEKKPDDRYQSAREIADVLADCEQQLKTHGEIRNFARIPGGGKSPAKSKYRRLAMSLCGVVALFSAAMLFGEPAYRYAANRAAIEVVPEPGLTSISIHCDGQAVTDWYDAKTRPTTTLPPGKYKLEPRFAPGRTVERWELRTRSTFSSRTEWQGVRAPEFEVARGEQVTVRAMMRDEPTTTPIPPTGSDGWVQLFNGKDLTGWKPHKDLMGKWEVKDGAITCDGSLCDYLFSERGDYQNFRLRVEAKVNAGGDSGVFFRCRPDPLVQYKKVAHPNLAGYEVQIAKLTENRTGSLWVFTDDLKPPYLTRQTELDLPPDEWFTLEVVARGRRLQVFLNSKNVADVENDQYSRGHIALQNLGEKAFIGKKTSVHFRKIEIKELPPSSLPPTPEAKSPPTAVGLFTDADVQRIKALAATEQVEEVRKELMRLNPGFDGKMEHKIEDGVVTEFRIVADQVTDIAPIRVWSALRVLECRGTAPNALLVDLMPLKGMDLAALRHLNLTNTKVGDAGLGIFNQCKNLRELNLWNTRVTDAGLDHFKECKGLTSLNLADTRVGDIGLANFKDCMGLEVLYLNSSKLTDMGLANFKDCKKLTALQIGDTEITDVGLVYFQDCKALARLYLHRTKVSDEGLTKFKGMPLTVLWIHNTGITDLTSLQGMPLEDIRLTPKNITSGLNILRDMKSLKMIGIDYNQSWPAAEFWERYDKGEFKE